MTINQESYGRRRGGGIVKKALAASLLAVTLAVPALISSASAADEVQAGRTIEAFLGSNLVNVQGYPANRAVTLDVLRNGVLVSSVSGRTDADGFAEFNHTGGGQVPRGDCFRPPVSPDVMPGDTIRTRTAGDPAGRFDSAVARDLSINFETIATDTTANTITVSGRVVSTEAGPIVPGTDVLELRLNKGNATNRWDTGENLDQDRANRRDLRVDIGEDLTGDGDGDPTTFTRVLRVSNDDAVDWQTNPGEVGLEWSVGAAPGAGEEVTPPAIFVADEAGGEALLGCPPIAENAVTSSSPKLINAANKAKGLRLAGISQNASAVSVTLDDQDGSTDDAINLSVTPAAAYVEGFQTWRTASITTQQLDTMKDGVLTAHATYTVNGVERPGASLRITKDTVAPRTPTATPRPGVYSRTQLVTLDAQPGTTIRYTLDGSRPTEASPVFKRPIQIASTKTIKAVAFDKAGNSSPLGSYRYVIRR